MTRVVGVTFLINCAVRGAPVGWLPRCRPAREHKLALPYWQYQNEYASTNLALCLSLRINLKCLNFPFVAENVIFHMCIRVL